MCKAFDNLLSVEDSMPEKTAGLNGYTAECLKRGSVICWMVSKIMKCIFHEQYGDDWLLHVWFMWVKVKIKNMSCNFWSKAFECWSEGFQLC